MTAKSQLSMESSMKSDTEAVGLKQKLVHEGRRLMTIFPRLFGTRFAPGELLASCLPS